MAGSYLGRLQLQKQIEERAKEATKSKELAEKENDSLQQFLKKCKECDVDLSEVEKSQRDFEASMATKDYPSALAHARKANETAKSAYLKKIGEVADSVDVLITLIQGAGTDARNATDILEKSKDRAVNDDLDGAMKFAKSAYDAAERSGHELFSQLFSQAQETIMQAKDMGDDVAIFEDQLTKAKSALENQEYEACMSQIKEVLEGAGEDIKSQVGASISRAEELVSAGEELGADMSRVAAHAERARKALDDLKFKESLSYAKKAESDGEGALSNRFQELARETRDTIKKMKNAKEDVSVPQQLLDQAMSALKEKKYIEALHALNTAHEKVHQAEFNSVLEIISQARDRFVLAKKVGVDMTKAIMLLNTSRDNLKLGKFEEAIRYAEQSRKEIDTALEMFYKARDQVVDLAKAVKFAADLGADPAKGKEMLAGARKAFEAQDYGKTGTLTNKGLTELKHLARDKVMEDIDVSDKAVKLGKEIGADVTEAEDVLQRAIEFLDKEEMLESVRLAQSSKSACDAAVTRTMSDRFESIGQFVKGFAGDGLSDVGESITLARQYVASCEFDKAHSLLKDVTGKIETIGQGECDRLIAQAKGKIECLRSMEGDVADLEILLTRAEEALSRKVYEDATARSRDIIQQVDEQSGRMVQTEFSALKDVLEEAKTIGIDTEDARSRLKEARAKADSQDNAEAFRIVKGINADLKKSIERYDEIKGKIRKAEELISEAGKTKVDVSPLLRMLDNARKAFSNGQLDDAEKILDKCTADTEKSLGMFLAAKFILSSKEGIDLAQENNIEVAGQVDLLAKAKEQMKLKRYDEALAIAKRCDAETRQIISTTIADMTKDLQRLLTDARNVGVDTAGPEKLAQNALGLVKEGNFAEALKCITSSKEDINHVKNLSSQAALEIRVARNNLRDAETLDIDVARSYELLNQAVEALTRHQYAIALELARKSSESSSEVTKSRIWGTLEKFRERIDKAAEEGLHIGTAEECVSEGIAAFKEGRYQDSLKLAMRCEMEMERAELQKDISTRAVEMAKRKLSDSMAEGIKSERLAELVERANALLAEGKYVDAMTAAIESGDELHNIRENLDSSRIELSGVRERVDRLKKVGLDTTEVDEVLDMAQDYLTAHEFAKCRDALKRASAKAAGLFETSIQGVMDTNKTMIAKAKAMGINTKDCENLLEVANTSFSEKLWDFAYQQAAACRESCLKLVSKKMTTLLDELEGRMASLKKLGASVGLMEGMASDAKKAISDGDVGKAFQLLMDADQRSSGIEDAHKKYLDISMAAESAIEILGRFGLSRREPERLVAMADIEREKDYDSAIELLAEALDTAKEMMEAYSPDITGSISAPGLQQAVEGSVVVTLKNVGKALAKDIVVQAEGDFEVVKGGNMQMLKPNTEAPVEIRIVPRQSGTIPVKVSVSAKRQLDGKGLKFELEESVNVYPAGPPFKLGRATDSTRCISCQGRIKPGFDILTCRCGGQLHLSCAKRTNACPVCGQKYVF